MKGAVIEDNRFKQVVGAIAPGSVLMQTWPLKGGISAEMTVFEIQHPDGRTSLTILRRPGEETLQRNPDAAEHEYRVLELTRSLGLATPAPYLLDQSGRIFPGPYLVIEYIDGKIEFPPAPGADFTAQFAEHLAKIHSVELLNRDLSFLPKQAYECPELSSNPPVKLDLSLDEKRIRGVLEKVRPFRQQNAPALLHGDYWPGNILWRDNRLIAVVDWEDAALGDPLIDFAISRLDILWIFGVDAMQAFTDQYQSLMDIDYTNLPYWDLCAALRLARLIGTDLAGWIAFFVPYGRRDIMEDSFGEHFQLFIRQALEKLAIE